MHGGIHFNFPNDVKWEKKTDFTVPGMYLVTFKTKYRENSGATMKKRLVVGITSVGTKILEHESETFAAGGSSIRVQLITGLFLARIRKPRGGSRGAMTRSLSGR